VGQHSQQVLSPLSLSLSLSSLSLSHIYVPSIIADIQKVRPDLLKEYTVDPEEATPEDPPPGFFEEKTVPDVGPIPLASFFTLSTIDPTNW